MDIEENRDHKEKKEVEKIITDNTKLQNTENNDKNINQDSLQRTENNDHQNTDTEMTDYKEN
jgi:hypothetical protein